MRSKVDIGPLSELSSKNVPKSKVEMANLRPERTGLAFVVFISQKRGGTLRCPVKVARVAKVRSSEMGHRRSSAGCPRRPRLPGAARSTRPRRIPRQPRWLLQDW